MIRRLKMIDQMIQNKNIEIDKEIENKEEQLNELNEQLKELKERREKECEKFKKVDRIRELNREIFKEE